jgi:hypothetical protein
MANDKAARLYPKEDFVFTSDDSPNARLYVRAEALKRASMSDKEARNYFELEAAFKRSMHQVEIVHIPIPFLVNAQKYKSRFLLLHLIQRYNRAKSAGNFISLDGKCYKGIWFAVRVEELSDFLKLMPDCVRASLKRLKKEHFIKYKATHIHYKDGTIVGVIFIQMNFTIMKEKLFPDDPNMNDISGDTEIVEVEKYKKSWKGIEEL